jgi:hypothetical protein
MEVLSSEGRIKKSRIRIELIILVSGNVVFSKNLPAIIQGSHKRGLVVSGSCFTLFHVRQKELKSRESLPNRAMLTFVCVGLKKNCEFFEWPQTLASSFDSSQSSHVSLSVPSSCSFSIWNMQIRV